MSFCDFSFFNAQKSFRKKRDFRYVFVEIYIEASWINADDILHHYYHVLCFR